MSVLILNREEVEEILTMKDCIGVMRDAFTALAKGGSYNPLRSIMRLPTKKGLFGMMPGYTSENDIFGIKAISVFPGNYKEGISSHQGVVLLFEGDHGRLIAVMDAEVITAVRTAAVSALATDVLAKKDSKILAILGAGVQGRRHLESISLVRGIERAYVWDIDDRYSQAYIASESPRYNFDITAAGSAEEAVKDADIICTVTPAKAPILRLKWVKPGAHINAVGACTPDAQEIESGLMAHSSLYTDCRESLFNEPGDFLIPKKEGLIAEDHVKGELGELIAGVISGRASDKEITLFKALGLAIDDLAAGYYVYEKASAKKTGISRDL